MTVLQEYVSIMFGIFSFTCMLYRVLSCAQHIHFVLIHNEQAETIRQQKPTTEPMTTIQEEVAFSICFLV